MGLARAVLACTSVRLLRGESVTALPASWYYMTGSQQKEFLIAGVAMHRHTSVAAIKSNWFPLPVFKMLHYY